MECHEKEKVRKQPGKAGSLCRPSDMIPEAQLLKPEK